MNKLALTLASVALISGCAAQSTTAPSTTAPSTTAAPTKPSASVTGPPSHSPAAPVTAPTSSRPGSSATLVYVGPAGAKPLHVTKSLSGPVLAHLVTLFGELSTPPSGTPQCMVATGELATIALTSKGHRLVYTVEGVGCRNVTLTSDGAAEPPMRNSMSLIEAIRAIAGLKGLAHPLTG